MLNVEILLKDRKELQEDVKEAWSIGAYNEPKDPVYIGSRETEYDTYHYFKDSDGRYYYESGRTMKFEKEIKELQKKRHRKRYAGNNGKK